MTGTMFAIGQHDTLPPLAATLYGADGTAADLTGAAVTFTMADVNTGAIVAAGSATVTDAAGGGVQYAWVAGDTDTPGQYYGEFQAAYSPTAKVTFPNTRSKLVINITADLDGA